MIHSPNDLIMAKVFSQDKKKIDDELPYYRSSTFSWLTF